MKKFLLLLIFSILFSCAQSQSCNNLGQNPGTAFPVCGSTTFNQNSVPICGNTTIPTPCTASAVVFQDKNPFWYKFTCFVSGLFAFQITPNNLGDDYDWQIFDITNRTPADVYTDPSLFVACNWSGLPGITGAAASGTSLVFCEGNVPNFSSMPQLIQGHTYIMLVSHFTNSQTGYSLSFGGGTAVITDTIGVPKMLTATASCDGTKVSIKLNKKLKCNSLAANGSDFTLSNTPSIITSAVGDSCNSGFDMDSLILTLNTALAGGTYTVTIKNGTDGNTLLDNCGAPVTVGDQLNFTIFPSKPPTYDSIVPVKCAPDELRIILKNPVQCLSVSPDGSDFTITGPSAVSIINATTICNNSQTTEVKLKLSAPIYKQGIYNVKLVNGIDGNTIQNKCGQNAPLGLAKSFIAYDTVSANFTYAISQHCSSDTVTFFHNGNNGVNTWNWTFDNASNSNFQNPVKGYAVFGNHIVKLIVSNGVCNDTVSSTLNLSSPIPINLLLTKNATTCALKNGTVSVKASGGAGGFTYFWTPGNFVTDSISNLLPGTYTVKVTDAIGCIKIDSIVVNAYSFVQIINIVGTDITCFGQKNGKANANLSGGLAPYTFNWTRGTSTFTGNPLQNLDTGNYVLIVKDTRGCSDTGNVIIRQPQKLSNAASIVPTSCGLPNGSSKITESGGTLPYSFAWLPTGGNNAFANNLSTGNYKVRITDRNGCKDSVQFIIAPSSPLTATVATSNVTCIGGNNGTATVTPFGTAPYTYSWSPLGGNNATSNGLAIGNYVATIKDAKGCIDTLHVKIVVENPLSIKISNVKNVSCNGGNDGLISVSASGTSPFNYSWLPNGGNASTTTSLPVGKYVVFVKDSKGCVLSDSATLSQPSPILTSITNSSTTCGLNNGMAAVTALGGVGGYSYLWTPINDTSKSIKNLAPRNYTITVLDINGCKKIDNVLIKAIPIVKINSINSTDVLCNGGQSGSAFANVIDGTPPYTYSWLNGQQVYTAKSIQNLSIGKYVLTVKDSTGCIAKDSTDINQPAILRLASFPSNTSCGLNNGKATATGVGGKPPYKFTWSTGLISDSVIGLNAGSYFVTVTDANGCTATDDNIKINSSKPISVTLGNDFNVCPGVEVKLSPGLFVSYLWQDNSKDTIFKASNSGIYSVRVTDNRACVATAKINLIDQCDDIVFPSAFTPNGDGKNEGFGPLGTLYAVSDYYLRVYNRWGQIIFSTNDPFKKWNGSTKDNILSTGTYVWVAEYIFNKLPKKVKKGSILLIK